MSDLINREDVIKCLQENGWLDDTNIDELIETIPTAYSVDKVVKDIMEAYGCHNCEQADTMACNECAELEVLNDICEIVKQG